MRRRCISLLVVGSFAGLPQHSAYADVVAEYFFYETMGDQVGLAARSFADYQAERQLWRDNIAAATAQLDACGGCASAQAELDKWQGIENEFQDVAGQLARISGMPPLLANFLDIDMPMTERRAPLEGYDFDRAKWLAEVNPACRAPGEAHFNCVDAFEQGTGSRYRWSGLQLGVEHMCYDTAKLFNACSVEDLDLLAQLTKMQQQRKAGRVIPEIVADDIRYTTVYFGDVPDQFELPFPPEEVVLKQLTEDPAKPKGVKLVTKPREGRSLVSARIHNFSWQDVTADDTCFDGIDNEEATQQAICQDLRDLSFGGNAPIIECEFTQANAPSHLRDTTLSWYGTRPEMAERDRLIAISPGHPILKVGDPRSTCDSAARSAGGYFILQPGSTLEPGTPVVGVMFGPEPDDVVKALNLGSVYEGTVAVSEVYSMAMTGYAVLLTEQQVEEASAFGPLEEVGQLVPVKLPK
ncbi:hypothetical protein FQV27_03565 [Paracoccus aurantiacus]|uniref:Uncharacterized protein n=1 Tax=Paracoccus aurantiacus TaxID=2599412 RepID=A0A5C6SBE2_9RHOB|nr:hypothetical protein [Paracoccus aurantiacus]TXB70935.1 hypothetical protein FQV27_03565 [Paracoccus aurantiacus]